MTFNEIAVIWTGFLVIGGLAIIGEAQHSSLGANVATPKHEISDAEYNAAAKQFSDHNHPSYKDKADFEARSPLGHATLDEMGILEDCTASRRSVSFCETYLDTLDLRDARNGRR